MGSGCGSPRGRRARVPSTLAASEAAPRGPPPGVHAPHGTRHARHAPRLVRVRRACRAERKLGCTHHTVVRGTPKAWCAPRLGTRTASVPCQSPPRKLPCAAQVWTALWIGMCTCTYHVMRVNTGRHRVCGVVPPPQGKLPCASGTYGTQGGGTCSLYVKHGCSTLWLCMHMHVALWLMLRLQSHAPYGCSTLWLCICMCMSSQHMLHVACGLACTCTCACYMHMCMCMCM